jgi:hypothetical protein
MNTCQDIATSATFAGLEERYAMATVLASAREKSTQHGGAVVREVRIVAGRVPGVSPRI